MNPHSEVSDTSEKRATLNMYLRTYWELLQSGRKGADRQYVKTVVAQAWLNKFTTNSSDSTLKLPLCKWFEGKNCLKSRAGVPKAGRQTTHLRSPRRRSAREFFAKDIQQELKNATNDRMTLDRSPKAHGLKVRNTVLNEMWASLDEERQELHKRQSTTQHAAALRQHRETMTNITLEECGFHYHLSQVLH
ncbi:hypothetical protein PHLCEN_2v2560 [Hermanssonia centrifuga]|uniref:Uncharacterized protein n=1 Tax=Hermanssonia centrifuga TaxID=98765 RepID=A0A2R6RLL0_9APHY|nr:hypothetical protein PHLCEN_2v2560 [Hermanssonia centrifuga]